MNMDVNTRVQILLWDSALNSFEYIPRSGITGSHSNSTPNFWGTSILFSTLDVPFYIANGARVSISPPTKVPIFTNICYFLFFIFLIGVHPNRHKVSLAVVLICISLVMSGCSIFFHVLFGHLHILFGEMSFKSFAHFWIRLFGFW